MELEVPDQSLSSCETLFSDLFSRVRSGLESDVATQTPEQRTRLKLRESHGLLWHTSDKSRSLLYIPNSTDLRADILYWHHDVPWCAHLGVEKTVAMVQNSFWWPSMGSEIKEYVRTCWQCQANKTDRIRRVPPLTPLSPPDACWRTVGVDLVVDLPPTEGNKYNAICVFVDHLSKMVRVLPTWTSLDTKGFAQLFIREIFTHYGMPQNIVSDRGPQWCSEFFRDLCDGLGIKLKLSTAYHPQTNGLVERTNEVVEAALRHYVSSDMNDWDQHLPFVEFALNNAYHKSIESTPFKMNRVSLPLNPFDVIINRQVANDTDRKSPLTSWMGMSQVSEGARTVVQTQAQFAWAKRCVHLAKSRMKEQHDRKGVLENLFTAGDLVWFNVKNLSLRHPSRRQKLLPKYMGPIKVLELVGRNAVKLDFPEALSIHPTVSVSLVKPFRARPGQSAPVVIDGELEYIVEAIISHNNSIETVEKYLKIRCTPTIRLKILKALKPKELQQLSADMQALFSSDKVN